VPWRFSDAGERRAHLRRSDTASEKPAQQGTFLRGVPPWSNKATEPSYQFVASKA
jgi:hypothetical protein